MKNMKRKSLIIALVLFAWIAQSVQAQRSDTLRVASYNLLNYPGSDAAQRNPFFRTVVYTMRPDILVVQEMWSESGVRRFLANVLNVYQDSLYTIVPFHDGPDTDNSLFLRKSRVTVVGTNYLRTALRDIADYTLQLEGNESILHVLSVHLKAGQEADDAQQRLSEATALRNYLNQFPASTDFIVVGDFNMYGSSEQAFQKLTGSEADDDGRCYDPLFAVGEWHNNYQFRSLHTQSTRKESFGGGASGGLDDRFDMILTSRSMLVKIVPGTYVTFGNDGFHFNDGLDRLPNMVVPDSVAVALYYASDHLPVMCSLAYHATTVRTKGSDEFAYTLHQNYPNPFNPETTIRYQLAGKSGVSLNVYNLLGQGVATLVNITQEPGVYRVQWNGTNRLGQKVATGVYLFQLKAGGITMTRKMVMMK